MRNKKIVSYVAEVDATKAAQIVRLQDNIQALDLRVVVLEKSLETIIDLLGQQNKVNKSFVELLGDK